MKSNIFISGVIGAVLLFGAFTCQAEKWDKSGFVDEKIETSYYNISSIKVKGKVVSWTEKYILKSDAATTLTTALSLHQACKQNIEKMGNVTQYQQDYQIEKGKFRGVAKRYYNEASKLICTNKDTGDEYKTVWNDILRGSPMQQAQYDLVTKYKVKFP